jgi:hypothetical protein
MTTNRLETMDSAFQSRIQVFIEYKPFSVGTRKKVWTNFINELDDEGMREELLGEMDFLKHLELNGRQIRNIMSLAQSLARRDIDETSGSCANQNDALNISHIKQAAKETIDFNIQQCRLGMKDASRSKLSINIRGQRKDTRCLEDDDDED